MPQGRFMLELDILSAAQPTPARMYLEACAGAGKTFTIEHLLVRLLTEPDSVQRRSVDQIAIVTFTRAAAADLRRRLRECLRRTATAIKEGQPTYPYLDERRKQLGDHLIWHLIAAAELDLDHAWIGTIHSFCSRLLRVFSDQMLDIVHGSQDRNLAPGKLRELILDFLRYGVPKEEIGRGQWRLLRSYRGGVGSIAKALQRLSASAGVTTSWCQLEVRLKAARLKRPLLTAEQLHALWILEAPNYKGLCDRAGAIKPEAERQSHLFASWLADGCADALHSVIEHGCPWTTYFRAELRKSRAAPCSAQATIVHDWIEQHLQQCIDDARDIRAILRHLSALLKPRMSAWLNSEGCLAPDALIAAARVKASDENWCKRVSAQLRTLIVDEFQDTDDGQWEIFSHLGDHLQLMLVGDPKQSIYSFRGADLYTCLKARKDFSAVDQKCLRHCYRSSEQLITALNYVMATLEGMDLPRWSEVMHLSPTLPAAKPPPALPLAAMEWGLVQGIHRSGSWPSKALVRDQLLPQLFAQAVRVHRAGVAWEDICILVRSAEEGITIAHYLVSAGIPAAFERGRSWEERAALPVLCDLVQLACSPSEDAALIRLLLGPLCGWKQDEVKSWRQGALAERIRRDITLLQSTLMRSGIVALAQVALGLQWHPPFRNLAEHISWKHLAEDLLMLAESLASQEVAAGPLGLHWPMTLQLAIHGHIVLPDQAPLPPERAVRVLTLHQSKGLEFEAVLAPALASRPPSGEGGPEQDAEKLRLLYVALTRAKRHLWAPWILDLKGKAPAVGDSAPLDLLGARIVAQAEQLARQPISTEASLLSKLDKHTLDGWIASAPQHTMQWAPAEPLDSLNAAAEQRPPQSNFWPQQDSRPQPLSWSSFSAQAAPSHTTAPAASSTFPRGKAFGSCVHICLAQMIMQHRMLNDQELALITEREGLNVEVDALQLLLRSVWEAPICGGGSLKGLPHHALRAEVPFALLDQSHTLRGWRGSIDLLINHGQHLLAVDWKSHDLGCSAEDYSSSNLERVINEGDYRLQAKLYLTALRAYGKQKNMPVPDRLHFVFVRGLALGARSTVAVNALGEVIDGA